MSKGLLSMHLSIHGILPSHINRDINWPAHWINVGLMNYPSGRNLEGDGNQEATWMLITRELVLAQMGSMGAQMKGIGGEFQIVFLWICCNFFIHSKIRHFGGKIWVKSFDCLKSFEGVPWPTSNRPNRFIFGSYPWICHWTACKMSLKIPEKSKNGHNSKTVNSNRWLSDRDQMLYKKYKSIFVQEYKK